METQASVVSCYEPERILRYEWLNAGSLEDGTVTARHSPGTDGVSECQSINDKSWEPLKQILQTIVFPGPSNFFPHKLTETNEMHFRHEISQLNGLHLVRE